jgi:hypothetical protein
MKMRLGPVALLAVLLPALGASAQPVEPCPTLPSDSGLEWSYYEGPDFDVCYARHSASRAQAFGIYLGNHPSFDPAKGTKVATGSVAGRDIVWYRGFGNSDESQSPGLQTVVTLGSQHKPYASVAHVWVPADEEPRLRLYLEVLKRIDFKD